MSHLRSDVLSMVGYSLPETLCDHDQRVKLDTNENPYECSTSVRHAIETVVQTGLGRYPDPTASEFRRKAAAILGVEPDWILCGNGSDDVLSICLRGFTRSGDRLQLTSPSYSFYDTLASVYNLQVDKIRFRPDWSLPDQYAKPSPDARLAVLANPNNPSGTVLTPDVIANIAGQLPCPLLIDEAYAEIAGVSCLELVAENMNILVSRSMSKSYSLAGIRFGYLIAQPQVIEQLNKVKEPYNCDALSIAAATAAIADQDWLTRRCSQIRETRERVRPQIEKLGFSVANSQANFLWCCHPQLSASLVCEQLKQRQVIVRHLVYPHCEGLRVAIGTDGEMDFLLEQLRDIVSCADSDD